MRRVDDFLEAANQRVNGIEVKLNAQSNDLALLKTMMKEMATQQISIKHTLQTLPGETSSSQNIHASQSPATIGEGITIFLHVTQAQKRLPYL